MPFVCSFRYQIYQDKPDPCINHGLIQPETDEVKLKCAAWGDWNPSRVPLCIPKVRANLEKNTLQIWILICFYFGSKILLIRNYFIWFSSISGLIWHIFRINLLSRCSWHVHTSSSSIEKFTDHNKQIKIFSCYASSPYDAYYDFGDYYSAIYNLFYGWKKNTP